MPRLIANGLSQDEFYHLKVSSYLISPEILRESSRRKTLCAEDDRGRFESWGMVGAGFIVFAHTPAVHYAAGLFYVYWLEEFPDSSRAAVRAHHSLETRPLSTSSSSSVASSTGGWVWEPQHRAHAFVFVLCGSLAAQVAEPRPRGKK